jgi:NAD dependent epimerase/dehydratase
MTDSPEQNVAGRRIFVTGADGFIGSHLVEACVRAGAKVKALACYSSFDDNGWLDQVSPDAGDALEIVRGDVRDAGLMRDMASDAEIVFHLAALIAIPYSYAAPASYVETNVMGTLNVLQAAQAAGAARVVHTSTSEVYGTAQTRPISEDHPLVGQSPYSASKIGADKMAEAAFHSFGLPVVTLRPFNTFGPRQSQRAVIPTTIRQALDPQATEIRLGDLTPERDFTFVSDTVRAFLAAAGPGAEPGNTYNAGTGAAVTVGEVVDRILALTGCNKTVAHDAARVRPESSEVRALIADNRRFRDATGWQPSVSLDDGLAETIDWWRDRPLDGLSAGYRI